MNEKSEPSKSSSKGAPSGAQTWEPAKEVQTNEIRYINLYEAEEKVYIRRITGFYQRLRRYTGIPLMLGFLLLPWLVIDGRPAVLFDLGERKFSILWLTFWPQDAIYLAWLLIMAAFLLRMPILNINWMEMRLLMNC